MRVRPDMGALAGDREGWVRCDAPQLARRGPPQVDLMDVLTGHGASTRVGLGNWCQTIGLPGKSFLEREVYEHILDGELPRVTEYCKLDTVETLLAFLVFAHHCGDLTTVELRWHVATVRETVAALPFEGWRDIAESLSDWPRWASAQKDPTVAP